MKFLRIIKPTATILAIDAFVLMLLFGSNYLPRTIHLFIELTSLKSNGPVLLLLFNCWCVLRNGYVLITQKNLLTREQKLQKSILVIVIIFPTIILFYGLYIIHTSGLHRDSNSIEAPRVPTNLN